MRMLISTAIILILCFFSMTINATSLSSEKLQLGKVQFETSTSSPLARAHFLMGLKYLHNFMYPLALREFKLAQQADSNFILSYWGQAMSYNWSLWSYQNKEKGSAVIKAASLLKNAKTLPLEQALMAAVAELYKPGPVQQTERKYMAAMRKLYESHPDNAEVASFYALSLIAYAFTCPYEQEGEDLLKTARAVLQPLVRSHPAHPGLIHYFIHASDIPNSSFLHQGLEVTPNVYTYLSDSSHVLHMPSHLFTALGSWPEAAHSNLLSLQASQRLCRFLEKEGINLNSGDTGLQSRHKKWTEKERYACDATNYYHSLEWLQYDYLEMGKTRQAEQLTRQMLKIAALEKEKNYEAWSYRMQARQMLYTQNYKPLAALPKPLFETSKDTNWAAYSECGLLLADGIAAVKNKQEHFLTPIDERFKFIIARLSSPAVESFKDSCLLAQTEVKAYKHAYLEHDYDTCHNELDKIQKVQAKLQSSHETLTLPYVPAQEVFGELMLDQPQYWAKSQQLYQDELKYYPNRYLALKGLKKLEKKMTANKNQGSNS